MTNTYTNIGTEINGLWVYLAVVNDELVLTDADSEVVADGDLASEMLWHFSTEQLDQFEAETHFMLEV